MARVTKKAKAAAIAVEVPQDDAEANDFIRRLGEAQRERDRIAADLNDKIAAETAKADEKAAEHVKSIADLTAGLQIFMTANRKRLTDGGKVKTVSFSMGEAGWRLRPPSVNLRKVEEVIAALKRLRLPGFIRTKEEVNKEAILEDPEKVKGVAGISIKQPEDFWIAPAETKLEEVRDA